MRTLICSIGFFASLFLAFPTFSQTITPVFPSQGTTISFGQLTSEGFQWESASEDNTYTLYISSPILPPNTNPIEVNNVVSPHSLDSQFIIYFKPGNYEWWVEGNDSNISSDRVSFTLGTNQDLVPTPTPLSPPTPTGDADGSMKIDAMDLFILSTQWGNQAQYYNAQMDLNQDDKINIGDILAYIERYGDSAPAPTPTPQIDRPHNFRFDPDHIVSWAESPDFTIHWDPPRYPANVEFRYDLMMIYPEGYTIEDTVVMNLTEPEYQPFPNGITLRGDYIVYLRAKDQNNTLSEIATAEFEVVQSKAPTPTPVPHNPDLTDDHNKDVVDIVAFNQSFGAVAGSENYNPRADFFTDGVIDFFDLLIFRSLYLQRDTEISVPTWVSAEAPEMEFVGGYPPCEVLERKTYDFTQGDPKQIVLGTEDRECGLAALNGSTLEEKGMTVSFSPVERAINYEITIRSNSQPNLSLTFDTEGETQDINIRWTLTIEEDQLFVTVRAIHPDGSKGDPSEELILILP